MKLKNKMLVSIGLPVILSLVILIFFASYFSNKMITNESKLTLNYQAEKYSSDTNTFVQRHISTLKSLGFSLESSGLNNEKILENLKYMTKNANNGYSVILGFSDKSYLDGSGWVANAEYDPTSRSWYKSAVSASDAIITAPYEISTKEIVVTLARKVTINGKIGVLGADMPMTSLKELVNSIKIGKTGKAFLLEGNGAYLADENYTINDNINAVDPELAKLIYSEGVPNFEYKGSIYQVSDVGNTGWLLVLHEPISEMLADANNLSRVMTIVGIISIVVIAAIIYLVANSLSNPIEHLSDNIAEISNYDFVLRDDSPAVIYSSRSDEMGKISNALVKLVNTLKETVIGINDIASQVSAASEELTASSEQSAVTAEDVARAVDEISQGAMSQAEDVQSSTEAMATMEEALNRNENSISDLNSATGEVFKAQQSGIESIKQLVEATEKVKSSTNIVNDVIQNTNASAQDISNASDMIKSIAEQTNLLALNAAIEAARAGEAGKGFAVVAEEIRKLAEQSNSFTEEISKIVLSLTDKTTEAVQIMTDVSKTVEEQGQKVDLTKNQFDLIAREIDNTKLSVNELNNAEKMLEEAKTKLLTINENLSALSEENAASAEESAASVEKQATSAQEIASASSNLANMAQEMTELIAKFKV